MGTVRTTLSLDDDVFSAAQTLAASSGKRLGEVVSQLIRRGLTAESQFARKNQLAVFEVPQDASMIPGDLAAKLLADEA